MRVLQEDSTMKRVTETFVPQGLTNHETERQVKRSAPNIHFFTVSTKFDQSSKIYFLLHALFFCTHKAAITKYNKLTIILIPNSSLWPNLSSLYYPSKRTRLGASRLKRTKGKQIQLSGKNYIIKAPQVKVLVRKLLVTSLFIIDRARRVYPKITDTLLYRFS